ncbi:SMP-30/gluconolactonase/LRE family protein [Mesorhizobium sp.]|uniref:SMP-30/gluconolactonase/LRE family protein n=1 Tax=Mesorhizobium sp. TaxID=1871066 RepID=UPI000FE68189|nr:SMP-30/gluconolactonase/LRE family protein [Mesorhizobium sp.]RWL52884.1 MAG: SMP-30/gluconolactonase/LRE family protein [Mesorhizobium sp.]
MAAADYYEVLDPRFARLFNGSAQVEKLFTGCRWAEGPAWFAAGRYVVWSDIPNNRMLRYDETDGSVGVFRQPSGNSNGNTVDRQGRLVTCEHSGRRVSRTEFDGSVTTFNVGKHGKKVSGGKVFADCTAGLFDGFRLDSDGRIWTSAADGIHCYDPDGTLIGKVKVPEVTANCVFGGNKFNCLYIAGTTSLYMVRLMVNGAKTY